MKKSICGIDCDTCGFGKDSGCKGCTELHGCPFGKKCFIAEYIELGGEDNFRLLKEKLIEEFNALSVPGMPKIQELLSVRSAVIPLFLPFLLLLP